MAVFADEIRYFSLEIGEWCGRKNKYSDIPTVSPRSSVVPDVFFLFGATSGPYTWYENAHFIKEFMFYIPEYIIDGRLVIHNAHRDMDLPVIQLGEVPENAGVVIISDSFDPAKHYAVLADFNLHTLCNCHVGVHKPCTADIPIRECWSASDGGELIFPDWERLCR